MNNKGFTLIELVGIVLILAAIFLVSFPSFLNMSKKDEEKKYDSMVSDLCLAGKSYIYSNIEDFNNLSVIGSNISINISELISYGNVDGNLKNPRTQASVSRDTLVYTVLQDYSLDCEYVEN